MIVTILVEYSKLLMKLLVNIEKPMNCLVLLVDLSPLHQGLFLPQNRYFRPCSKFVLQAVFTSCRTEVEMRLIYIKHI